MSEKKKDGTLGSFLRSVREAKGMSLREAEQATDGQVSNAYLSQLENDKIEQPSPHILHHLAKAYGIDYQLLMQKAGYIRQSTEEERSQGKRKGKVATFAIDDLTDEEEHAMWEFAAFLRSRRNKK